MNIIFKTKKQHDQELERLDYIIDHYSRNEGKLDKLDAQNFINDTVTRKNNILYTDLPRQSIEKINLDVYQEILTLYL